MMPIICWGGIVRVCHQIACTDCVIHFATVPIQHMLPSMSVHWDICKFWGRRVDGLGPQSLPLHGSFCVWVGALGFPRWCVCVCVCACVRVQLPPNSRRHHQALFLSSSSFLPPLSLIPKVNLFTVILKGELFAVIVRTDEGQALRGGPACP